MFFERTLQIPLFHPYELNVKVYNLQAAIMVQIAHFHSARTPKRLVLLGGSTYAFLLR